MSAQRKATSAAVILTAAGFIANAAAAQELKSASEIAAALAPTRGIRVEAKAILQVQFRLGSAELTDQAQHQVAELAKALEDERLVARRFEVAGHTDTTGGAALNRDLSRRRAEAVKSVLVSRYGIDSERLDAVGYGFDQLLLPDQPEAALNRRVEIVDRGQYTE